MSPGTRTVLALPVLLMTTASALMTGQTGPGYMHRSWVARGSRSPCPVTLADLGVHAVAEAVSSKVCTVDFGRITTQTVTRPELHPQENALLVKVEWASVNPCNWKTFICNPLPGWVPGSDFAGTVAEVGSGCTDYSIGDRVWGTAGGSFSEYLRVTCDHSRLGKVPTGMSLQQAGVLGVTGTTAYESLRWAGAPWKHLPTVLVIGGSSGTGHMGIQLAKVFGAGKVIATASAGNAEFVKQLGTDEVLDYKTSNWWDVLAPGSVDIIYDCVCLEGTGDHAYHVLRDGGAFVTIQKQSDASQRSIQSRPDVRHLGHQGMPSSRATLDALSDLVARGKLNSTIDSVFPLDRVADAFRQAMEGHTVGKLAIKVS